MQYRAVSRPLMAPLRHGDRIDKCPLSGAG
jgi:hypothetical protein